MHRGEGETREGPLPLPSRYYAHAIQHPQPKYTQTPQGLHQDVAAPRSVGSLFPTMATKHIVADDAPQTGCVINNVAIPDSARINTMFRNLPSL